MINQSNSNKFNSSNQQQQQQSYYGSYQQSSSFITPLFSTSTMQPKVQNLFEQSNTAPQSIINQLDFFNDSWDALAYKKYQNNTNIEQNDSQFFNIFAPCQQQTQNMNSMNQFHQLPIIYSPFESSQSYQTYSNQAKFNTSPYTPQKQNLHSNQQKQNKKWMSGSINSTPLTAPCSSMKEDPNQTSNQFINQSDITEFLYNTNEQTNKKQQFQKSKINCCISASSSCKSSNCNSDSEESCFLSTNTHISSTSQSKQQKKLYLKNHIEEIWNRPYDGTFNKKNSPIAY
ncbi:hypothetical protein ABPG74_021093 [Tetrahymena malaccensis]